MKIHTIAMLILFLMSCNPAYQPISEVYDFPPDPEPGACYAKAEISIPNTSKVSILDWLQVICPDDYSFKIMNAINKGLKEKGYTVGKIIKSKGYTYENNTYVIDEISCQALKKFQKDNNLPVGLLDTETMKQFKINFKNGIWVIVE